jgi:hypothetical protein
MGMWQNQIDERIGTKAGRDLEVSTIRVIFDIAIKVEIEMEMGAER